MATFFRRDDWVQSALGQAISGANVYVTSQPTIPASFNDEGFFIPPSPLVQLYSDPAGRNPITQPVQTDGFGHAFYYTASGTYTITYYSPQIGITTLPDQVIAGVVVPVNTIPPSGHQDGTNRVFTLPSTPSNFLLLFVNGVFQFPGNDYTISGATITMTTAPLSTIRPVIRGISVRTNHEKTSHFATVLLRALCR
jgi:hypothetical protein